MFGFCVNVEGTRVDESLADPTATSLVDKYEAMIQASQQRTQERDALLREWEAKLEQAETSGQLHKMRSKKELEKPELPPPLPMPHRWSQEEFIEKKPVTFTSHLIRPLL